MNRKNLYQILTLFIVTILSCTLNSCSKDDEDNENQMTVKNLTNVDWYDASIVFKESMDSESKVVQMVNIGDVKVGETFAVIKEGSYFYINALNKHGKIFMSKILYSSDNVSVKSSDILINL